MSAVDFADRNRILVGLLVVAVFGAGAIALRGLPVDAVPDVTNVQVQVVSQAPELAPLEVERYVTAPVERALSGVPRLRQVRSISRAGLSVVTAVFEEGMDLHHARTIVNERLQGLRDGLPRGVRSDLGPISTGLGEIYQFFVRGAGRSPGELRTLLEWNIAPRLRSVPGVTEVLAFGGLAQQYEVRLNPAALAARQVSLDDVYRALQANNANAGGGVIERAGEQLLLRGEALLRGIADIQNVVVRTDATGSAVLVRHLGEVALGSKLRTGVVTRDGQGEEVAGVVLMLFGANSRDVSRSVTTRVHELERELPHGVHIVPYYNRSELINRTLHTVQTNLVEGAGVVLFVLIVCLGSWRAGVLVAFAIPFAMLFALLGMRVFGVSGNLMSLGAIDFGIVVDGAVVIVERMLHALHGADEARAGPKLSRREMMLAAARGSLRGVMFSVGIILLVYVPLGTLEDVEGKMFRPMVATMVLALAGAMLYTLLVVPAFGPWLLERERGKTPWLMRGLERLAAVPARFAVKRPWIACAITLAVIVGTGPLMLGLGAEFIPRLEEGALALDVRRLPSVSLSQSVLVQTEMERILRTVPEVRSVVSRTGRPEGGTDPQGPEASDCFVFLRDPSHWRPGLDRDGLVADVSRRLRALPGIQVSFSQPIEMRVSDLIAGVKSDVAIKIFGDDMDQLRTLATQVAAVVRRVRGAADTKVETTTGLPTMRARVRRDRLAALGVDASAVLDAVQASRIGRTVGAIYDGPRRFDLTVRLDLPEGLSVSQLGDLPIGTRAGRLVPLGELADVQDEIGDVQISREDFRRRIVVETNVRGRDLVSFVADARAAVEREVRLPEGVRIEWGGQFANFERAKNRLAQVVPIALGVIAVMLLILLGNAARAAIVFLNVPLAIAGGAAALALRRLTFSIPAGVGLIAVSGLAVLSGVLVVQALALRPPDESPLERVLAAARDAVRPVATAALVAAIGFIPMAIASSAGAEVQRPLATVVIGGVLSSSMLTFLFLPAALLLLERRAARVRESETQDVEE